MTGPFTVKICGVTSVADALAAAEAGADAVGLNFYPRSPRYVTTDAAREIAAALPTGIVRVGLLVNSLPEEVAALAAAGAIDLWQLHGDESPEQLRQIVQQTGRPALRAFRLAGGESSAADGLRPVMEYLATCRDLGCSPTAVLLDAYQPDSYGGTGRLGDWPLAAEYVRRRREDRGLPPLVLAGGLKAENVAAAVLEVRPDAIDTASGVESSPGRKDAGLMSRFAAAAWQTLRACEETPSRS